MAGVTLMDISRNSVIIQLCFVEEHQSKIEKGFTSLRRFGQVETMDEI